MLMLCACFFIYICPVFSCWFSTGRGGRVLWAVQGLLVGSLALLAGVTLKREAAIHSLNRWLFNRIYALTKQSLKTPVKHIRHIWFNFFSGKSGSLEDSWFPWLRRKELWNMRFASNIGGKGKTSTKGPQILIFATCEKSRLIFESSTAMLRTM